MSFTQTVPSTGALSTVARDTGRRGLTYGAWISAVGVLFSFTGAGGALVQYAYPLAILVVGGWFLARRQWNSYLALTILTWMFASEMRRFADWHAGYHANSIIVITPSLLSLLSLPWALRARRRVRRHVAVFFGVAGLAMAVSFVVGVVGNGPAAALVDVLYLVGPAATGLFILTVPDRESGVRQILANTAAAGCLLMGIYALVQFLVLPPWDAKWILDSGVTSIGNAEAQDFRAFATLATTGPLGQVLAAFLLLVAAERDPRRFILPTLFGLPALAITLVRAGWIGVVVGTVILLLLGRTRALRIAAVTLVVLIVLFAAGGPLISRVAERATETASSGTEDTSFSARLAFQERIAPEALSDPVGLGFGATGRATKVGDTAASDAHFQNFDSGIFESLTRYGAIAGLLLIGTLIFVLISVVMYARGGTAFEASCAAALVALGVGFVFTDTLRAVYGLVFWALLGYVGRADLPVVRRGRRPAGKAGEGEQRHPTAELETVGA